MDTPAGALDVEMLKLFASKTSVRYRGGFEGNSGKESDLRGSGLPKPVLVLLLSQSPESCKGGVLFLT